MRRVSWRFVFVVYKYARRSQTSLLWAGQCKETLSPVTTNSIRKVQQAISINLFSCRGTYRLTLNIGKRSGQGAAGKLRQLKILRKFLPLVSGALKITYRGLYKHWHLLGPA